MDANGSSKGKCPEDQSHSSKCSHECLQEALTAADATLSKQCDSSISGEPNGRGESVQTGNINNKKMCLQAEKSGGKTGSDLAISSSVQKGVFLLGAVLGVLSVILAMNSSGTSKQSSLHISRLIESLEKHGYSSMIHDHRERHAYGSPDLLTTDAKQELVDRLLQRNLQKKDVDEDLEVDALVKATEPKFMTIDVSGLKKKRKDGEELFCVVFDAGSTGSRVHIYRWRFEDNGVQLVKEVYRWVTPGLSDFVHKPEAITDNIQPLIDVAMETVPASLHKSTPLVFKATAGLRLLDADGAEMLLQRVRELLALTDFDFISGDIGIMGGRDEGLFGWITINYLLGNLDGSSLTAAALDLGGGSIQITYKPQHLAYFGEDLGLLELFGDGYDLYTHSYLGQGLKAARNGTLQEALDGTLTSNCLPVGYSGIFTYEGIDYKVRGPEVASQDECWRQVGQFLSTSGIVTPWDLIGNHQNPQVYLFSYFYEVLEWAGVITDGEAEKIMTIDDFYNAAFRECHSEIQHPSHPFLCQDLTYITRLLGETYMLWDKPLHVVEEIKSGEVSWSLGAALDALSRLHSE
ncbi:hypothetical protein V1264_018207 [Littorina saxatilis]